MKNYGEYAPELAADFIEQWEGFRATAYQCSAGRWTVGFGHTKGVKQGDVVTYHEAYEALVADIREHVDGLMRYVNVPVSEGEFVALTSLAFNVGVGAVSRSKLLKKLNAGDTEGAAHEFLDFNRAGGVVVRGLARRREAEVKVFLGGS